MKLVEITGKYLPRNNTYSRYLEREGYKLPEVSGSGGYLLVIYTPKQSSKSFKSLIDAEDSTPEGREHWQIYDVDRKCPVSEPQWWWSEFMTGALATRSAIGGD